MNRTPSRSCASKPHLSKRTDPTSGSTHNSASSLNFSLSTPPWSEAASPKSKSCSARDSFGGLNPRQGGGSSLGVAKDWRAGEPLQLRDLPLRDKLRKGLMRWDNGDLAKEIEAVLQPTKPTSRYSKDAHVGLVLSPQEVAEVLGDGLQTEQGLARLRALRELLSRSDSTDSRNFCDTCIQVASKIKVKGLRGWRRSVRVGTGICEIPAIAGGAVCAVCGGVLGGFAGAILDPVFEGEPANYLNPLHALESFSYSARRVGWEAGKFGANALAYVPHRLMAANESIVDRALTNEQHMTWARKRLNASAENRAKATGQDSSNK